MISELFNGLIFRPIFNLLLVLYSLVGDFGVAIIIFTIVVKVLLFPLLKSQTLQTKRLQDLQPELKKIKAKAKGNRQLETMMTLNLYKQNNVKMSASFFSALIQLPILIAMFTVIRVFLTDVNAISNAAYDFTKNLDTIKILIDSHSEFKPMLFGLIDMSVIPFQFNAGVHSFVMTLFVVGAAWTQYYILNSTVKEKNPTNRRIRDILAEAGEGKEPDQTEINNIMMGKMNKVMPIIILFSFGMLYGAIGFYQFVSGMIAILQRKIIISKTIQAEVVPVDELEVEERLKRAKSAEILFQSRQKSSKKRKAVKTTVKRISSQPNSSDQVTKKKTG